MSGTNQIYNTVLASLRTSTDMLVRLQEQAATGSRVNRASDNPADASSVNATNGIFSRRKRPSAPVAAAANVPPKRRSTVDTVTGVTRSARRSVPATDPLGFNFRTTESDSPGRSMFPLTEAPRESRVPETR